MHWMIEPYRRYFDFSGRSRRMEYWMFVLFNLAVSVVISAVFGVQEVRQSGLMVGFDSRLTGTGGLVQNLFGLVSFIPGMAVSIRRLHDQDRSGWLMLLLLIPFFGWFALFVMMLLSGTDGPNRFGQDPKKPYDASAFD